jgi:ABC-2 type transport system ATP-binding protein
MPVVERDSRPLVLSGVGKSYGTRTALQPVNLEIRQGEIFALLGPNGAGKSTLIHCISGISTQSVGSISVFGYDTVSEFRATRRLVGLVPQEINFDPFFTPFECLMIQMGLMGVEPDAAWADELLARMSLTSHRNAYTRTLSGGMKRRLLIAKALVHRPRLLFLDEPTAGVDVELRRDLWNQVELLRDQGTTVILTTHYLEEAERLADRVGVINKGRLLLVESKADLMRQFDARQVRITTESPLPEVLPPTLDVALVRQAPCVLSAPWQGAEHMAGLLHSVSAHFPVQDVSIQRTSLEDIFVDLIREADRAGV